MKLVAPPTKAISHIQNTAPGPPSAIAVPTPAMLPTPTRDAAEIERLECRHRLRLAVVGARRAVRECAEHLGDEAELHHAGPHGEVHPE